MFGDMNMNMLAGMDATYLMVGGFTMLLSMLTQGLLKSAYSRYGKVANSRNMSGADAAKLMLSAEGITDVQIIRQQSGWLSDHYNPATKTINLSPEVYDNRSLAAVGIACHEAGHALQHANGYALLKVRSLLVYSAGFGSKLGIPLIVIGMAIGALGLAKFGLILFGMVFLFQFITLPVEFNASSRSKEALLSHGIVRAGAEADGVASVLNAAALTYVAAAASSLAYLLYFAMRLGLLGNRSRD